MVRERVMCRGNKKNVEQIDVRVRESDHDRKARQENGKRTDN
jgi:hypothetical protein